MTKPMRKSDLAVPVDKTGDEAMMRAYRALRDRPDMADEERESFKRALLAGKNSAWAWFAIRHLKDLTDTERGVLCDTVVRSKDGEMMLWVLGEPGLTKGQRNVLIEGVIAVEITSWAIIALEQVPDLSEVQRKKLDRVSIGLDPEE